MMAEEAVAMLTISRLISEIAETDPHVVMQRVWHGNGHA
jgi:hypothetical protein